MEFESIEKLQMVNETLKNIDTAITRLQERTVQIHTVDDFLLSPFGMEKLDAACMVIIALGEAVKTLDKLTDKKLLPTYPCCLASCRTSYYNTNDFKELLYYGVTNAA